MLVFVDRGSMLIKRLVVGKVPIFCGATSLRGFEKFYGCAEW